MAAGKKKDGCLTCNNILGFFSDELQKQFVSAKKRMEFAATMAQTFRLSALRHYIEKARWLLPPQQKIWSIWPDSADKKFDVFALHYEFFTHVITSSTSQFWTADSEKDKPFNIYCRGRKLVKRKGLTCDKLSVLNDDGRTGHALTRICQSWKCPDGSLKIERSKPVASMFKLHCFDIELLRGSHQISLTYHNFLKPKNMIVL